MAAHSRVAVQCKALQLEGGEEFVKSHCYWNIRSELSVGDDMLLVYPSPQWSVIEDCCELIERPILHIHDAVWATTRGVGRAFRTTGSSAVTGLAQVDDFDYVPKYERAPPRPPRRLAHTPRPPSLSPLRARAGSIAPRR